MAAIAFILLYGFDLVYESTVYSERRWVMIKGGGYSRVQPVILRLRALATSLTQGKDCDAALKRY